jgi:hypothetical protein
MEWYIMFHPHISTRSEKALKATALDQNRAKKLAEYIVTIFNTNQQLSTCGVLNTWKLNSRQKAPISLRHWQIFQTCFCDGWHRDFLANYAGHDGWWEQHSPAFHVLDFGANDEVSPGGIDADMNTFITALPLSPSPRLPDPSNETDGPSSPITDYVVNPRSRLGEYAASLAKTFDIHKMKYVAFDVAVNIQHPDRNGEKMALTISRAAVEDMFAGAARPSIYPQAFTQDAVHCQAPNPPGFISRCCIDRINSEFHDRFRHDNLVQGYKCQWYSAYKPFVRHTDDELTVTRGFTTAVVGLPNVGQQHNRRIHQCQTKAFEAVVGEGGNAETRDGAWWARAVRPLSQLGATEIRAQETRAFRREQLRFQRAIEKDHSGIRCEQRLSVDVEGIPDAQRSFTTAFLPVRGYMELFQVRSECYWRHLRIVPADLFPGLVQAFCRFFEVIQLHFLEVWDTCHSRSAPLPYQEGASIIDRLANHAVTGRPWVLVPRIMKHLGTLLHLRHFGWPYIDPARLDLRNCHIDVQKWPKAKTGSQPYLSHLKGVSFYYGKGVMSLVETYLLQRNFQNARDVPRSIEKLEAWFADFFRDVYQPEMAEIIHSSTRRHVHAQARRVPVASRSSGEQDPIAKAHGIIDAWKDDAEQFQRGPYGLLCAVYDLQPAHVATWRAKATKAGEEEITSIDMARLLLKDLANSTQLALSGAFGSASLYPKGCAWPAVLGNMFDLAHRSLETADSRTLADIISCALDQAHLQVMPGSHSSKRFTVRRRFCVIPRRTLDPAPEAMAAPPPLARTLPWMDCLPFDRLPVVIQRGFSRHFEALSENDVTFQLIDRTRMLVTEHLRSDVVQLALIHCVILLNCTERLTATKDWEVVTKSAAGHSRDRWVVVLLTKICWFIWKDRYRTAECTKFNADAGQSTWDLDLTFSYPRMLTLVVAHWKVALSILVKLGWVTTAKAGPYPKVSECRAIPLHVIVEQYTDQLQLLRTRPQEMLMRLMCNRNADHQTRELWLNRFQPLWSYRPFDERNEEQDSA